jgi:hypothetical protein
MTTAVHDVSLEALACTERWLALMREAHPQFPEPLLRLFAEADAAPTSEAIAACLDCDVAHAEAWRRVVATHLVSPSHYAPRFAAEDTLSERRMQHQNYQDDCRATRARLAELQREIEGTLAYSHLGESQAAEVQERLEALDHERVDLLRHQADLPGAGALIQDALNEAHAQVAQAHEALQHAQVAHLQDVEDAWLHEGLTLLQPLRVLVHQAQTLDQAWERLGVKASAEVGSGRLRDTLVQQLRSRAPV